MTQLTDKIYVVQLTPLGDEYKSLRILPTDSKWQVPYLKYSYRSIYHTNRRGEDFYCGEEEPLAPGTWRFLFTTKTATEEDARKVVERDDFIGGYKDYDTDRFHHDTPFIKATNSLISLLHSKNLDPNKNYALIEKQSSDGTE